jgi:aspartyl aminopeptidase
MLILFTCMITFQFSKLTSQLKYTRGLLNMRLNSSQRIRGLPDSRSTSDIIHDYNDKIQDCMKFLDESPEPFHCVSLASDRLLSEGFQYLDEDLSWRRDVRLQRGGKYFMTRSGSLIAFVVGSKFEVGNGFKVLGAHTDSPNLKLKPCSKRSGSKYIQLNVECYGGGLWHTWFDRDLSIAGRVIIRNETDDSTTYHTRLIKVDRSILRIPNLCIHLRTPDERDNFKINKEDHLVPILCDEVEKPLGNPKTVTNSTNSVADTTTLKKENTIMNESKTIPNKDSTITEGSWVSSQQPELIHLLAKELNCKAEDITDFELSLYDVQKAAQTGLSKEYICSSRVDNLASCYVVLDVLLDYGKSMEDLKNDTDISLIALFDHEEVGSGSSVGAGSALMRDTMERIHYAFDNSLELSSSSTPSTLNTLDLNELFKISLSRYDDVKHIFILKFDVFCFVYAITTDR